VTGPLWLDPETRAFPPIPPELEVDVAIVGAGFSGLGAAWALRDEDMTAALLEARGVAGGASGRNVGFVVAGPAVRFRDSVHAVGLEQTLEIWELTRRNQATLGQIVDVLQIECGYLRRGSMSLAASDEEWEEMLADFGAMRSAGIEVCRVERAMLPVPFDRMYCGGIYRAGNAEIQPASFLREVAGRLGSRVSIYEGARITALEHDGGWRLCAGSAQVRARRVILATNAYTADLVPLPITPTRGQVLATEPLDRVVVPCPMHANRGFQYWRQTPDGRLVIGGWRDLAIGAEIGYGEVIHTGIHQALDRFAAAVLGSAPRVAYRWAGIMGFTPDHMPLVGALPALDGISIAAGYSGHGVAMAFVCGMLVAEVALGRSPRIPDAFNPARFA
jgi:glycine/D-amino acid oxidase-like deaminating enzyme